MAKEKQLTLRTVRKWAPELCKKVSRRYKEYLTKLKKERIKSILSDVQNAAIALHNNGVFPSKGRIYKKLGSSVFFRRWD